VSASVIGIDGPRLLSEQCATCIFHPGNLMHLMPGRLKQLSGETLRDDSFIPCHETLEYGPREWPERAVCRGWWDAYHDQSNWARIMLIIFGKFVEVPPPPKEEEC
jgi:hypothetical protein